MYVIYASETCPMAGKIRNNLKRDDGRRMLMA